MLVLVEEHQPGSVEFASVQYYGWGLANREALLPTRRQLEFCVAKLKEAGERLKGKTRVVFVVPDYYAKFPKPCVGGWGRKLMLVSPDGAVLPCHAAGAIPGIQFENVKEKSLREIWENSPAFQKFRGEEWMQDPCKSCDRRPPGLRRLPLPGDVAGGRRSRHGSRLLPRAHARQGGRNPRRSESAKARDTRRKTYLPLPPKPLVRLKCLLSATAKLPLLRCEPKRQIKIWRHSFGLKSGNIAHSI